MDPLEAANKRVKEVEEENKLLKQLLMTRDSALLWNKIRSEIGLTVDKITKQFSKFDDTLKKWSDLSAELFQEMFVRGRGTESSLLGQKWKLNCEKKTLIKKKKEILKLRMELEVKKFQQVEAEWTNPAVEKFNFIQGMTSKQRKKLLKKCDDNDDKAREALSKFENLSEEWDGLLSNLEEYLSQIDKIYADYRNDTKK